MVDIWPKKNGIDPFAGNYRKASVYIWFSQNILLFYPGFFKNYFWHVAPQYNYNNEDGSFPFCWLKSWVFSSTGESTSSMELPITLPRTASYDK